MPIAQADILGIQGTGWLSDEIRRLTGGGPLSHVALVACTDGGYPLVIEAVSPRVRMVPLSVSTANAAAAWTISLPTLTPMQRSVIAAKAATLIGNPYNYWDLLMQAMDSATASKWWAEYWSGSGVFGEVCSMADAIAYDAVGISIGGDANIVTPNDIWTWAQASPATVTKMI